MFGVTEKSMFIHKGGDSLSNLKPSGSKPFIELYLGGTFFFLVDYKVLVFDTFYVIKPVTPFIVICVYFVMPSKS